MFFAMLKIKNSDLRMVWITPYISNCIKWVGEFYIHRLFCYPAIEKVFIVFFCFCFQWMLGLSKKRKSFPFVSLKERRVGKIFKLNFFILIIQVVGRILTGKKNVNTKKVFTVWIKRYYFPFKFIMLINII